MDIFLHLVFASVSSLFAFVLSYLFLRNKGKKSYEPDFVNAKMEFQKKNYDVAIKYFNDVLKSVNQSNPFFINSLVGIAEIYIEKHDYYNAKKYIDEAINESKAKKNELLKRQIQKLEQEIVKHKIEPPPLTKL